MRTNPQPTNRSQARRHFLFLLVLLLPRFTDAAQSGRPNILFAIADDSDFELRVPDTIKP